MTFKHFGLAIVPVLAACSITASLDCKKHQDNGPHLVCLEDYGPEPTRLKETVKEFYARVLRYPDSMSDLTISEPQEYWSGTKIGAASYGYVVCTKFNAISSQAGRIEALNDYLIIRDDVVIQRISGSEWSRKPIC